jgi:hypothetical protein
LAGSFFGCSFADADAPRFLLLDVPNAPKNFVTLSPTLIMRAIPGRPMSTDFRLENPIPLPHGSYTFLMRFTEPEKK